MRWSRPDILNASREVSRFMGGANPAQYAALLRLMSFCTSTPERGLTLAPKGRWDGKNKDFLFRIEGICDAEFCKDQLTRRSVGGHSVYLNEAPVALSCRMQRIVALSITEAELIQAVECVQDMLFVWRLLKEMDLKVEMPMILYIDNQGAIDIINNWSSSGRTRHIDTRLKFVRELKEANILRVVWRESSLNEADALSKNLHGPLFKKHVTKWVGEDQYG